MNKQILSQILNQILFEDKDIIVVKKQFGIPSQADKSGNPDLYSAIKEYILNKGENAENISIIHRLDCPVSGIMVFGKTKQAGANLSKSLQTGEFNKTYLAVVCGKAEGEKRLVDWILKNQRLNISKIVNKNSPNSKEGILEYKALKTIEHNNQTLSLVEIKLYTGRHHQIRVQMANANLPLYGDTKYNPELLRKRNQGNIGLCAYKLEFPHPITKKVLHFSINETEEPFSFFI